MKKFLLGFLLACSLAHADTIATANNSSGGMIVLTNSKCTSRDGLVAYTNDSLGRTILGCWFAEDSFVFVAWNDGDVRTYPYGIFVIKQKGKSL